METTYSKVKFKIQRTRERGDGKPSERSPDNNADVTYSEVRIVQPDQTNAKTAPDAADPGHSNLPGPHDPADSSPKAVTPAWTKERLLLRSLCVILFAAGLIITVLYVLGNFSQKEKFISEKDDRIKELQTENKNLNTSLKEKDDRIKELETENKNLNTSLKDHEKRIEQLQMEIKNLETSLKTVLNEDCAKDWKYFGGKCYSIFYENKTWIGSRDACVAAGGHLVIITSTEEQNFLKSLKSGSKAERYWIGLTDAVVEGDWRWLDGTKLSQTPKYWTRNEPDDWKGHNNEHPEGEDCGLMELSNTSYGLWDGFCNEETIKYKRICETKATK